ncbi:MAG: radical SAM protein, partial [Desulfuromonas sp.]|nr:radical SAM protein [Desulfuromonas sp.]
MLKQEGLCLPETLTLAITGQCNLRCSHCWVDAGASLSASWVPKDILQQVMENFSQIGGKAVRLTGGEPLLHPHWLELVEIADSYGLKVLLQTNAMLLSEDDLQALKKLSLKSLTVQISFDGATAAVHDLVRGAGAFDQTLRAVERLVDYGFGRSVTLFFTEMHHNLHELPGLVVLAKTLGVGEVCSGSIVLCGRAVGARNILPPSPDQYLSLLQRYVDDHAFQLLYNEMGNISALEWYRSGMSQHQCDFIRNPYLTPKGVLYPCLMCHADNYSVSGVFEIGLFAALDEGASRWAALQKISRERSSLIPACRACSLRQGCAGGCLGRTWGSFGDFFVPE